MDRRRLHRAVDRADRHRRDRRLGVVVTVGGPALPPAAWHPDPTGRHELRYWDGASWSEHVSNGGQVASDDLAAPFGSTQRTAPAGSAGAPATELGAAPPSVAASSTGILDTDASSSA